MDLFKTQEERRRVDQDLFGPSSGLYVPSANADADVESDSWNSRQGIQSQARNEDYAGHSCLIDGSNLLHRAWAVAPKRSRPSDGAEIGAVQVFSGMILKLLRRMGQGRHPPTHIAVFFDPPRADSWRREIFPAYKADRPETDPELRSQILMMRALCTAAGLAEGLARRHEADDLIATYAADAASRGEFVSILSNDKDLMQLIGPRILQYDGVRERWINTAAVRERFGVSPPNSETTSPWPETRPMACPAPEGSGRLRPQRF